MTDKQYIRKAASAIDAVIQQEQPDTLIDLCAILARYAPSFKLHRKMYFGGYQGYRVTIYDDGCGTSYTIPKRGEVYHLAQASEFLKIP